MIAGHADGDVVAAVVVGGGPTGVVSATMLAQRGIETLVIERWPDVYPLPRAVHLDDEIYRLLQGIGAADAFARISRPTTGMRLLDAQHRTMAEFRRNRPLGEHGYPQANMFNQPDLERILRENMAGFPLARLVSGVELVAIDQNRADGPAEICLTLRDVASGAETRLWAHAVLGCDGANSTARDQIGAHLDDLRFAERWLVLDVRSAQQLDAWHGVHQVCDPDRAATFMQIGADRYRFEFRLNANESVDDLINPQRLAQLIRPWTKNIPFEDLELIRRAEYTFKAKIADRWRDRRVFLLGDAAHLTPPFIGQGMCAGMRDAANLTWKLAAVLDGRADEQILNTYQSERAPHARALIRKAVTVGKVMTGGRGGAARVRRVALAALCRLPGVSDKALDAKPPRLSNGPLVRSSHRPRSLPGTLAPQPWVTVDGQRRRLDDVLGDSFAVLVTGAPDPHLRRLARRLDAPVIRVVGADYEPEDPGPGCIVAVDHDDVLPIWMNRGGAGTVLLRPDRVVLAQAPPRRGNALGAGLTRHSAPWLHLVATSRRSTIGGKDALPHPA